MRGERWRIPRPVVVLASIAVAVVVAGSVGTGRSDEPLVAAGPGPAVPVVGVELRTSEVLVRTGDGLVLPATLRVPVPVAPTAAAPVAPAMVLVHGGGPGRREDYAAIARTFTGAGVTTLTYDKRSIGYSLTERSYSQLADDAIAAAEVLRAQPGVDASRVGLWGLSEGGWVAPLAASRDSRTAFLVVVGANGLAPLRQQTWAEAVEVQSAGVRGSLVDAASTRTYQLIDALGLFPEAHYDSAPVLRELELPVLGVWGALDRSTPAVESAAAFREGLDAAGNQHYVLRTFPGAGHTLRTSSDGAAEGPALVPGYLDLVTTWVGAAAGGRPQPTTVTGTGWQPRPTADVPPAPWYASAPAHGVALGVMVSGFAGSGLVGAVRRATRRRRPGSAIPEAPVTTPAAAAVVAAAGLTTVTGALVYLGRLTVVRGGAVMDPGPVLAGRPLVWLVLQALSVTTVLAGTATALHLVRRRGLPRVERVRLALVLAAATVFVPWCLHWGLLLP